MLIGYARVSTVDQDLALQLDALHAAGCEKIYTDQASGVRVARPGLTDALAYAREGDTLCIWKLDRLGRSTKGLVDLAADLQARNIELRSLTEGIDTRTTAGKLVYNILAAFAEMERDHMLERTRAGLEAARKAGRVGGRPRLMTPGKLAAARTLLAAGTPPRDVASTVGVSLATLYRHLPASIVRQPAELSDPG